MLPVPLHHHTTCDPAALPSQYRANSGIAAFAARIGSTTFAMISEGKLSVRTASGSIDVGAPTTKYAATHGCCLVERVRVGKKHKSYWSWLIHLPGGAGTITVIPIPNKFMPSRYQWSKRVGIQPLVHPDCPLIALR